MVLQSCVPHTWSATVTEKDRHANPSGRQIRLPSPMKSPAATLPPTGKFVPMKAGVCAARLTRSRAIIMPAPTN